MNKRALKNVQKFYPEVKRVIDARFPLFLEVLKEDVNKLAVKNHQACAVAEACKHLANVEGAIIALRTAYIVKGKTVTRYKLSENIIREIVSFDRSGIFEPGMYTLNPPDHKLGSALIGGRKKVRTHLGKPTPKFYHFTKGIRTKLNQI